jgi:pimeloyl-ACP methyl ester carboxylesterase
MSALPAIARRVAWSALVALALAPEALAQTADPAPLRRRPFWGGGILPPDSTGGARVARLAAGSPGERAGIRMDDRILAVNGQSARDAAAFMRSYRGLRAGDTLRASISRAGGAPFDVTIPLPPLPEEAIPGAVVSYGSVVNAAGQRLRTITTRPTAATGRRPGMLLVGWLSCGSVEIPLQGGDGLSRLFKAVAAGSGHVFMRVDKAGTGDSQGECSETDLDTELSGYRAALDALRARPDVDPARIYILGASIGGALAPFVAAMLPKDAPVRGLIVTGGFAKSWYEHQLEQERRRLMLAGLAPGEVNAQLVGFAELYTEFLLRKRTPGDIVSRLPHLAPIWYDEPAHQYGRPARYYHQVQALNVLEAWSRISAPVLILHGEYDWIMTRADQDLVADAVNRNRPGAVRIVDLPRAGHDLDTYATLPDSFNDSSPIYDPLVEREVLTWLKSN